MLEEALVCWERYPKVAVHKTGRAWLQIQANLMLAPNTIDAYARGLEQYLSFSLESGIQVETVSKDHVARYVHFLAKKPHPQARSIGSRGGLSNGTIQLRLTVIRLYYDYLIEEGVRKQHPVGRGQYTRGNRINGTAHRGLIPRYKTLPKIPTEAEWQRIVRVMAAEPLRNRVMFALAYDAALRREELCSLDLRDLDPAHRMMRIRAEITKNRLERTIPYSVASGRLLVGYMHHRRRLSRVQGKLFLSESRRNRAEPISIWTWSKVIKAVATRACAPDFTTHTFRHLCLTDLARAGWDIHEIATFAGHRNTDTTLQYIHLSGRDLAEKLARASDSLHERRLKFMATVRSFAAVEHGAGRSKRPLPIPRPGRPARLLRLRRESRLPHPPLLQPGFQARGYRRG
jgi:integrase/recombinase XerD